MLGNETAETAPRAGEPTALDSLSALAAIEAGVCESASLGASYPASAGALAWRRRQLRDDVNGSGLPLTSVESDSGRGALAAAMGLAMSGRRAATFLSGPDLAAGQDLLNQAAGQHLPLVIHLACRAIAAHAQAIGSGHEAYHAAGDSGVIQLFATNVQEAADFALIGRYTAERSLVPVLVAMDGEQTAGAAQDVRLVDNEVAREFLGEPSSRIEPPTEAQRMIFGERRRLVPRLYDLERPMMLGPAQGPESWGLGAAGMRPYFHGHVEKLLAEAFEEFARLTGRKYSGLIQHRTKDAEIVLVAQGAAVETAIATADWARNNTPSKVGVLGIRCLRPLPQSEIAAILKNAKTIAVMERLDTPLAGEGPLLRELRAINNRAGDNSRFVNVPYGLGGLPLRAADLTALIDKLNNPEQSTVYLGLDFARGDSHYPKRQAVMDALRRDYEGIEDLGLRSTKAGPDIRPNGAVTITFHRISGGENETLAGEAAALIHSAVGGHLRSRPALTWQRSDEPCIDLLTHSAEPLNDPGDDPKIDIALIAAQNAGQTTIKASRLAPGSTVLMFGDPEDAGSLPRIPSSTRAMIEAGAAELHLTGIPDAADIKPWQRNETLLGGLLAIFLNRTGNTGLTPAKVRTAREVALAHLDQTVREKRLAAFVAGFDGIKKIDRTSLPPATEMKAADQAATPQLAAKMSGSDSALGSLPGFYDQTGVLYRNNHRDELTADPNLAVGAAAALSSMFHNLGAHADGILPVFEPETCEGDGRLWSSCPDGSIAATVISAKSVIDTGIALAGEAGTPADALRSIVGKLAARVNKIIAEMETPPMTAKGLLTQAFNDLMAKDDRRDSLQESFAVVINTIGDLPLGPTEIFFAEPEREKRGTGEFLVAAVNPDACK